MLTIEPGQLVSDICVNVSEIACIELSETVVVITLRQSGVQRSILFDSLTAAHNFWLAARTAMQESKTVVATN